MPSWASPRFRAFTWRSNFSSGCGCVASGVPARSLSRFLLSSFSSARSSRAGTTSSTQSPASRSRSPRTRLWQYANARPRFLQRMPQLTERQITLGEILSKRTTAAAPELVDPLENKAVRCYSCGHRCKVLNGLSGICKVRYNEDGVLRGPRGYVAALQVDPIEKKPFFHAFPGALALSFGMLGCDYHCGYCQNWVTSQALRDPAALAPPTDVEPSDLIRLAKRHGAKVITSTYNEPLI